MELVLEVFVELEEAEITTGVVELFTEGTLVLDDEDEPA